jgi:hypothetical protein
VIVYVPTIGRKIDNIRVPDAAKTCEGKLAKYGVFVKHLVAWGFHPAALSHRGHVSPVLPEPHVCTRKILNDHEGNLSHGA